MAHDQTVRTLYKKLLTLYPRSFRERFAESMEQTFNDLCNDRKRRREQSLVVFTFWMFTETGVAIVKEHGKRTKERNTMKNRAKNLAAAALIGIIIVLPLAILEAVHNDITSENVFGLLLLFGVLWLLPTTFIVILMSMIRNARAGNNLVANPVALLLRVTSLALIAVVWGWGFMDQLPCFLGIPNCD